VERLISYNISLQMVAQVVPGGINLNHDAALTATIWAFDANNPWVIGVRAPQYQVLDTLADAENHLKDVVRDAATKIANNPHNSVVISSVGLRQGADGKEIGEAEVRYKLAQYESFSVALPDVEGLGLPDLYSNAVFAALASKAKALLAAIEWT
jgi:hypothetical protein